MHFGKQTFEQITHVVTCFGQGSGSHRGGETYQEMVTKALNGTGITHLKWPTSNPFLGLATLDATAPPASANLGCNRPFAST